MYFFMKVWEKIYKNIQVNLDGIETVRKLTEDREHAVILLPTHKSFMDLWILGALHLELGLQYPLNYGE
jgi:glycerol-3-phosphate O-acyltransferase